MNAQTKEDFRAQLLSTAPYDASLRPVGEILTDSADWLMQMCNGLATQAGWWIDPETGEDVRTWPPKFFKLWVSAKLMLAVTELAEAMEGHRKGLQDDHLPDFDMLTVELGDAVIRIFDLAGGLGLRLPEAIVAKLKYNATRADHKLENRLKEGGKSI